MKPLLLLATRPEDDAADDEYAAFLRFTGLDESGLRRVRLDRAPLGDVDLATVGGVILGGSPFTVSDPEAGKSPTQRRVEAELDGLLARVLADRVPFLGACYGIGVLGRRVGAVVDRTFGEPVGPVEVSLTADGLADPLFRALPGTFEAFVGHKEAVRRLPAAAVRLAGSPACPVQAFRVGASAWATQFHPELDAAGLCTRIEVYRHAGYFAPEEADDLKQRARASAVTDPPALLRAFVTLCARVPAR